MGHLGLEYEHNFDPNFTVESEEEEKQDDEEGTGEAGEGA